MSTASVEQPEEVLSRESVSMERPGGLREALSTGSSQR